MNRTLIASSLATALVVSTNAQSAELSISVTNLTQGIYFTPLIIGAHTDSASLFEVGEAASSELQMVAEGGDISGIATVLSSVNANTVENPAVGLLAPGANVQAELTTTEGNNVLSLLSMLLPTNDGFIGLDNWTIPNTPGTYTVYLNAYDAGTEANDEIINGGGAPGIAGIPADPTSMGGTGASGITNSETNDTIHIHRGNLGDDDNAAGKSDLNNTVHRWLNPVARVTVTVQ
ncbi:spondin domain-containing protein [Aestuariibacter sp. AA17]|uniref:Spondin domain-containing protein n=1 Tax=Fluctibacter corallii TaxID=2984329 RepID=A0ABT3A3X0_9ALTE|nr:spondin domain-containing protein [Aestuariibacter sp. AA17]MCV2883379.1 spondin domain-containing protein [Aestuariibacter sp. AA17]